MLPKAGKMCYDAGSWENIIPAPVRIAIYLYSLPIQVPINVQACSHNNYTNLGFHQKMLCYGQVNALLLLSMFYLYICFPIIIWHLYDSAPVQ